MGKGSTGIVQNEVVQEKALTTFVVKACIFWLPGTDLNRQPSD